MMTARGTRTMLIARLPLRRTPGGEHRLERPVGDALHLEPEPADGGLVARLRKIAQRRGDQAADGGRVGLPHRFQRRGGVVHRHGARQADAAVGQRLGHRRAALELVAHLADQLRQHVLERDHPGRAAELVDHQRLVRAPLAIVAQHAVRGHALVHGRDRADQLGERRLPAAVHEPLHQVPGVQHADDVVERLAIDRQPRIRARGHDRHDLVERRVDIQRRHAAPRHHQLLRLPEVQLQRALQPLGARRAPAARHRGSRRSAARSHPGSGCAGAPASARPSRAAGTGRCRSARR